MGGSAGVGGRVQCRYVCNAANGALLRDVCVAAAAWLGAIRRLAISRRVLSAGLTRGACPSRGVKSTDSDDGLDPDEKLEYQSERQWAPKEGGEDENVWVERFDARTQRKYWWNTV